MRMSSMSAAGLAVMAAGLVAASEPALAAPALSDLKGRWILATPQPGHLGFVIDVVGDHVALMETVRAGLAECVLTAAGARSGSAVSVKVSHFNVRCQGGHLTVHPEECTFTAGGADTAQVVCGKGKTLGRAVMLRRVPRN